MGRAYKCDRCPTLFEHKKALTKQGEIYEMQAKFYRIVFRLEVSNYDDSTKEPELCPSCRVDILNAIIDKLKPVEVTK